jgi:Domain of unknown function (DUF4434)
MQLAITVAALGEFCGSEVRLPVLCSIRTASRAALVTAVLLSCRGPALHAANPSARLNGTFLQLSVQHKNWTDPQWSELFEYFRRLQLSEVILQWTTYDDIVFYGSPAEKSDSPLTKILAAASRTGLKVWVGLYLDSEYWNRVAEGQATSAYLNRLRLRSLGIAEDLAHLVRQQAAFAGWYLPEEIDDSNWQTPEARRELLRHLGLVSGRLHELTPGARIAISTFSNARVSPAQFRDFWAEAFHKSTLSTVLLQDGIGVHKLELNEFPLYAGALADVARSLGRDFGIVVELFQQISGLPLDTGAFHASPAPWERVRSQMVIAHQFTGYVVGFSVPEYMTPLGIPGAEQLYANYLKERTGQQ